MKLVAKSLLVLASLTMSQLTLAFVDVSYSEATSKWGIGFGASEQDAAASSLQVCSQRSGTNDCIVVRKYNRPGYGAIVKTCDGHPCNHTIEGNYSNAKDAREYTTFLCRKSHPSASCAIAEEWSDGLGLNAYERQLIGKGSSSNTARTSEVKNEPSVPPVKPLPDILKNPVEISSATKKSTQNIQTNTCEESDKYSNTSIESLTQIAKNGDSIAQYQLFKRYGVGDKVNKDINVSLAWLKESVKNENCSAKYMLGKFLIEVNRDEGIKLLASAANAGHFDAQAKLVEYYDPRIKGNSNSNSNTTEYIKWLLALANNNSPLAQHGIAIVYFDGKMVKRDINEWIKWEKRSAENGQLLAQVFLCMQYYKGEVVKKNTPEAVRWCEMSASRGDKETQRILSIIYSEGDGVPVNLQKAFNNLLALAEQGDVLSQSLVGNWYMRGYGVAKNWETGIEWTRKAAANGDKSAQKLLKELNVVN